MSAVITGCFAIVVAASSARTSSDIQKINEQFSKPSAKIAWPLPQQPARPCEYVAGWLRNISADEHLFVVLPTQEENGQKTYNYPVNVDGTREKWSTTVPVQMSTPLANYGIHLYALKRNDRLVFLGHTGLPAGSELDNIPVTRSEETLTSSRADPCSR
jgi:hypothetical protein